MASSFCKLLKDIDPTSTFSASAMEWAFQPDPSGSQANRAFLDWLVTHTDPAVHVLSPVEVEAYPSHLFVTAVDWTI
jgi:hypothetical protein